MERNGNITPIFSLVEEKKLVSEAALEKLHRKLDHGAGKMAQRVKALAVRADHLSSIPRTYVVGKENPLAYVVL